MSDYEILNNVLSRFRNVKKINSNEWECSCPTINHKNNDKNPSLHIAVGNNKIVFDCKCGCDYKDILASVQLKPQDTYLNQGSNNKDRYLVATYDYHNFNNEYCYSRLRYEPKRFYTMIINGNEKIKPGIPLKEFKAIYGDVNKIKKAIENNETIFYVEGEKDVDTLTKKGFIAFTCGSATSFYPGIVKELEGAKIIILADNDEPGLNLATRIKRTLTDVADSVRIVLPLTTKKGADVTDYFQEGHTITEFEELIKSQDEKNMIKNAMGENAIIEQNLISCFRDIKPEIYYSINDRKNGDLYAEVFKNNVRWNINAKEWYFYNGKAWEMDVGGMIANRLGKILAKALHKYSTELDPKTYGTYQKSVLNLNKRKVRNNMLEDAKEKYYISNKDLDKDIYLLNCQNCVINLKTFEVLEHDPNLLLSKITNAEYKEGATSKDFEEFMDVVMEGNKEKIRFIQKILGYSLTGDTREETCYILYGKSTRNGKSTLVETISYMLGNEKGYAINTQAETLASKSNDTKRASGDIARLEGCRYLNASEPNKNLVFNVALLKTLIGRDTITARELYEREKQFIPQFKLFINTNFLPRVTDDTLFSSDRLTVISFNKHFDESEQDKTLKDRLRQKENMTGILSWCIEGLKMYYKEGAKRPKDVIDATREYREISDTVGNFLSERMEYKEGMNTTGSDVYREFESWCNDNGYHPLNKGNFFADLRTKNLLRKTGTVNKRTERNVVCNYIISSQFEHAEDTPFY